MTAPNSAYSSEGGILYNKDKTTLIRCPGSKTGSVTLPTSVTTVEDSAFRSCNNLTNVTIPTSVTNIGSFAFRECGSLVAALFIGDAPSITRNGWSASFGSNSFDFAVYYFDEKTGFTSPNWMGYPTVNMGVSSPLSPWLVSNGFSHNADINADPNGDGVSLLMAYALNLNPNEHLGNRLPKAELHGNTVSMNYYSRSAGVTYRVEVSKDLVTWETTDVTTSDPDANGIVAASIDRDEVCGFLRLVVVKE